MLRLRDALRSDAAGLPVLALVAPLADFLPAKPHPDGCLILAPATAGGRAAQAPSPSTPQGIARLRLRSTLRDGADRRHPSGAADLTVRLGLGSA